MTLSKSQRAAVREMFGGRCAYCGHPLTDRWHADHVIPVWRDTTYVVGSDGMYRTKTIGMNRPQNDVIENHFPACVPCNLHKSVHGLEEWRKKLQRQIEIAMKACSPLRQAKRFGLVQFSDAPIVFHFEKFGPTATNPEKADRSQG